MFDTDLPCSTTRMAPPPDRARPFRGRPAGHAALAEWPEWAVLRPGWQQIDNAEIVALSECLRAPRSLQ